MSIALLKYVPQMKLDPLEFETTECMRDISKSKSGILFSPEQKRKSHMMIKCKDTLRMSHLVSLSWSCQ